MHGKCVERSFLLGRQLNLGLKSLGLKRALMLADIQAAPRCTEDLASVLFDASRQQQLSETLSIATDEAGGVVIRESKSFVLVELWIVERREML